MICLENFEFEYDPFPYGIGVNMFSDSDYKKLSSSYPPIELFKFMQYHGDKWSLSELNNPQLYFEFIKKNDVWRRLYSDVKDRCFVAKTLELLKENYIDLGIDEKNLSNTNLVDLIKRTKKIKTRFEFSMMSAEGGHILPHTDSPQKIITFVFSMPLEHEWNDGWGGGTDILRPINMRQNFNYMNKYLAFDEVCQLKAIPYKPNQGMIFIKTFNSLHGVSAMAGPKSIMRKTLTLNIEMVG